MSDTRAGRYVPTSTGRDDSGPVTYAQEPTAWTGWIAFAGTLMLLLGVFHVIQGLVAIFKDQYFVVGSSGLIVTVDYTAWGWVHLLFGLVVIAAGAGLLVGQMWARVVGVIVAFLSAVLNVGFLSAYPVWSAIMIAIDVVAIWAITVHGSEMKAVRASR